MFDFAGRTDKAQHVRVAAALTYYRNIKADISLAIEQDPARQASMAQDALETAILGMRRAIPGRVVTEAGLFSRLFPKMRRQTRVHPSFDNDAFAMFLSLLFDAIHNLPALMAPPGSAACSHPDPASEIAQALACLRLMPVTSAAADSRFERLFMARESAGATDLQGAA
jgi:hypothetical protein